MFRKVIATLGGLLAAALLVASPAAAQSAYGPNYQSAYGTYGGQTCAHANSATAAGVYNPYYAANPIIGPQVNPSAPTVGGSAGMANDDAGCLTAPLGSVQISNLLERPVVTSWSNCVAPHYAETCTPNVSPILVRPPFDVAGIDYPIGVEASVVAGGFKDPTSATFTTDGTAVVGGTTLTGVKPTGGSIQVGSLILQAPGNCTGCVAAGIPAATFVTAYNPTAGTITLSQGITAVVPANEVVASSRLEADTWQGSGNNAWCVDEGASLQHQIYCKFGTASANALMDIEGFDFQNTAYGCTQLMLGNQGAASSTERIRDNHFGSSVPNTRCYGPAVTNSAQAFSMTNGGAVAIDFENNTFDFGADLDGSNSVGFNLSVYGKITVRYNALLNSPFRPSTLSLGTSNAAYNTNRVTGNADFLWEYNAVPRCQYGNNGNHFEHGEPVGYYTIGNMVWIGNTTLFDINTTPYGSGGLSAPIYNSNGAGGSTYNHSYVDENVSILNQAIGLSQSGVTIARIDHGNQYLSLDERFNYGASYGNAGMFTCEGSNTLMGSASSPNAAALVLGGNVDMLNGAGINALRGKYTSVGGTFTAGGTLTTPLATTDGSTAPDNFYNTLNGDCPVNGVSP